MGGAPGGALATKQACRDGGFLGERGYKASTGQNDGSTAAGKWGQAQHSCSPSDPELPPPDMGTYRASYIPTEADIPPKKEAGPLSTCDRIMTLPNRESLGVSSQLNGELELRQVRVMEYTQLHHSASLTRPDRTTLGLETGVLCHEPGALGVEFHSTDVV